MLRTALFNVSRSSARPSLLTRRVAIPSRQLFARQQSSKSSDEQDLRAARKLNDKLQENWKSSILTYEQLKPKTLSPSNDAYLIDVREPDEVMRGSIPSSAFRTEHGFDKPGKAQEVVFYCRSGKRSASACDIARRNGYENVINYEGSWLDWVFREGRKPSA